MLVFGTPRTAVFVHMDTVGFMVRYQDQLLPVGSPEIDPDMVHFPYHSAGTILSGQYTGNPEN